MLEPEMDAFLRRLCPRLEDSWQGASSEEIAEIEEIAEQPLPSFYRWLLSTVGRSGGSLPSFFDHYRAQSVIAAYDAGEVDARPPLLRVGRTEDPMMPMEIFYDLSRPCRGDAFVRTAVAGDELSDEAETLREWLAWLTLISLRINPSPQWCRGRLKDHGGDVTGQLAPVLATLGFGSSITHGPYCGVYERQDAALACKVDAEPQHRDLLVFNLGGSDAGSLRRYLGEISTQTDIQVTVTRWEPPLPKL